MNKHRGNRCWHDNWRRIAPTSGDNKTNFHPTLLEKELNTNKETEEHTNKETEEHKTPTWATHLHNMNGPPTYTYLTLNDNDEVKEQIGSSRRRSQHLRLHLRRRRHHHNKSTTHNEPTTSPTTTTSTSTPSSDATHRQAQATTLYHTHRQSRHQPHQHNDIQRRCDCHRYLLQPPALSHRLNNQHRHSDSTSQRRPPATMTTYRGQDCPEPSHRGPRGRLHTRRRGRGQHHDLRRHGSHLRLNENNDDERQRTTCPSPSKPPSQHNA